MLTELNIFYLCQKSGFIKSQNYLCWFIRQVLKEVTDKRVAYFPLVPEIGANIINADLQGKC